MASTRRKVTFVLATAIVLVVSAVAFERWSGARSFHERHERWLKEQRPVYDQMAAKVMEQKPALTSVPTRRWRPL
jgi:hypothetical protein